MSGRYRIDRTRDWRELTDDEYEARFQRLCTVFHPAVAAVMAADPTLGENARDRIIDD